MPRLTLKTEVLTMSADFHIFVRECPSKIGIQRFHALASPAVGFPRLHSPLPVAKTLAPIANCGRSIGADRRSKIEVQDKGPSNQGAEVLG